MASRELGGSRRRRHGRTPSIEKLRCATGSLVFAARSGHTGSASPLPLERSPDALGQSFGEGRITQSAVRPPGEPASDCPVDQGGPTGGTGTTPPDVREFRRAPLSG